MRALIAAAILASGIAFVGMTNVSAAPANGAVIGQSVDTLNSVTTAHWRGPSRPRCHRRFRSWWFWC
jgi:hypothetical protein